MDYLYQNDLISGSCQKTFLSDGHGASRTLSTFLGSEQNKKIKNEPYAAVILQQIGKYMLKIKLWTVFFYQIHFLPQEHILQEYN